MGSQLLSGLDFGKRDEPPGLTDMHEVLIAWLDFQRHEFKRKLRDLSPDQLVEWSVPPVELSVLGLVRHMQQMEHIYLTWGLEGGDRVEAYGEDDYAGGSTETIVEDVRLYLAEIERADKAIASLSSLDSLGLGHGQPLGATLVKMIDEYALHSGQAHMLRFAALGEIVR
jgi:hypothetical protein